MYVSIGSIDDPRLRPYRNLPAARRDRRAKRFIAESEFTVRRLLESRFEVESVLATPPAAERLAALVPPTAQILVASRSILSEIVGYRFHAGVLACGLRPRIPRVSEVLSKESPSGLVVALSQVADAENVGSIVRSAAAFGADAVVLDRRCADAFSRRAIRVSVGNVFKLPIVECDDLGSELAGLREAAGYALHAAVTDTDATPLRAAAPTGRDVLLFGGEGYGLDADLVELCGGRVTIPTREDVDSLNVAVAGAVVLYHFAQAAARCGSDGRSAEPK